MLASRRATCALLAAAALAAVPAARAQTAYTFTNVIDTTTDLGILGNEGLALDGDTVAIHRFSDIFTMTGGVRTNIAKVGDSTPAGTIQGLNVAQFLSLSGYTVAFIADTTSALGGNAVLTGAGGPLTKIAAEGDATPAGQIASIRGSSRASIDGNSVAFAATVRPSITSTVFVSTGGVLTTIAGPAATITEFHEGPRLSGNRVAFTKDGVSDFEILSVADGSQTTIVKLGDPAPIGTFRHGLLRTPEISGDVVAFQGYYSDGSDNGVGVFTGNGGPLTTIVKTGDPAPGGTFFDVTLGQIAENGQQVSFTGSWENNGSGVFVSDGGVISTVIKRGDLLFGQPVQILRTEKVPLDPHGSGRVAFGYILANGVRGIAMATPVPEPAAGVTGAIAALIAARVRRARHVVPS
jgi:hypothetical protein